MFINDRTNNYKINPMNVHGIITKYLLFNGFDMVLDLERSKNGYIYDSLHDRKLLDMFTFFGSTPIGINHPKMFDKDFLEILTRVAINKPSNSDFYSVELADFVETFSEIALPKSYHHVFFIEGGALAVENALKVAFDWKVRKNFQKGYKEEKGLRVIHFKEAFHGRSGYTMSLTNTDPNKIKYFPKFNWPRINNPKLSFPITREVIRNVEIEEQKAYKQIYDALEENKDDIACLIIEPIQAEGGDNHFRKEFFSNLREICSANEILLIFDEVQTGLGLTGKMWAYEHFVEPDIIAFGKKMQVCGILTNSRIDDVDDNCFKKPGRINSTWGGNLTDMVRSKRYLEIINEDNLIENANSMGKYLLDNLLNLQIEFPEILSNVRGLGLMCALDLPTKDIRDDFRKEIFRNGMILLPCGERSIRFRPRLNLLKENIDECINILQNSIFSLKNRLLK